MYISHRMEEIFRIGDRVTVFRDGKYIATKMIKDTTLDELLKLMVGREMSQYYPKVDVTPGDVLLEVKDFKQGKTLKGVSFYARAGEITTFYGLMGAGRTELVRAVFGADKIESGEIYIKGKKANINSCDDAAKYNIALLTEDRKNQGLILAFDLNNNISLANLKKHCTPLGFKLKEELQANIELCEKLRVKTPSIKQKAGNLSGGNQQKVVICKWLNADSEIIIFDEPTRGIDVGAKIEIYKIMNALKEEGKAVIVVSSELTEAIGVSDRMYVMHEGEITGCLEKEDLVGITEEDVLKYATGVARNVG
jgi:ABC-type sugar transport system ATPase subunit